MAEELLLRIESKLDSKLDEITERLDCLENHKQQHETLKQQHETLEQQHETLKQQHETLKQEQQQHIANDRERLATIALLQSELFETSARVQEHALVQANSARKGAEFEGDVLEPLVRRFFEGFTNTTVTNTSKTPRSGDVISVTERNETSPIGLKIVYDAKDYKQTTIHAAHVNKLVDDARTQGADGAILLYKELPKMYKDGLVDMKVDTHSIFPDTGFNREMVFVCTPERLPDAIHALFTRKTLEQSCPDQTAQNMMKDVAGLCGVWMSLFRPLIKHHTIEGLKALNSSMYEKYFKLKRDCQFMDTSDAALCALKEELQDILGFEEHAQSGRGSSKGMIPSKGLKRAHS